MIPMANENQDKEIAMLKAKIKKLDKKIDGILERLVYAERKKKSGK